MYKTLHSRSTFWSWDVEKLHAAVARSAFCKWKCTKHLSFGPLFEVEMLKNCTPLWREAHCQVKMYKTSQFRTTFRSWDVEKLRAAVARSTFPSQNVKKLTVSEHFLKLRCWKIVRRCGEKHMLKNCTPLWREAHFEVKMLKNWRSRSTFWSWDVEKLSAAVARSTFSSENVQNTACSDHFCWKIAGRCGEKHTACSDHFLMLRCRKEKHIFKWKCKSVSQFVS